MLVNTVNKMKILKSIAQFDFIVSPHDIYHAIYPLYYIGWLFGVAPYTFLRKNGKVLVETSFLPMIRSFIQISLFVAGVGWSVYTRPSPFSASNMSVKLEYLQDVFSALLSAVEVVVACAFASKSAEVFRSIEEIDQCFQRVAIWVPYKKVYIQILLNLLASMLFVIGTLTMTVTYLMEEDDVLQQIYTLAIYFFPYCLALLVLMQYTHYLNILRLRYTFLNQYLNALVYEKAVYNGWTNTYVENGYKKAPSSKTISKNVLGISDPTFVVNQAAIIYIKLRVTAVLINHSFSLQLLLRITIAFISIVTSLFLIAIRFSKANVTEDNQMDINIMFTTWAFFNAFSVTGSIWITSATCNEANKCPRLLHKIRNYTHNADLQNTIEIQSLQLYHNKLQFTVCGLFPLDFTLLYTIVAGVTTYLVILIQFNNSEFLTKSKSVNGTM